MLPHLATLGSVMSLHLHCWALRMLKEGGGSCGPSTLCRGLRPGRGSSQLSQGQREGMTTQEETCNGTPTYILLPAS